MWKKSLTVLSLVNVMLFSACNSANSKIEKKYNLEFANTGNSVFSRYNLNSYLELDATDLKIPNGFDKQFSDGRFIKKTVFYLFIENNSVIYNEINNFYRKNGTFKSASQKDFYLIDTLINVKLSVEEKLGTYGDLKLFWITSFSAEMPH